MSSCQKRLFLYLRGLLSSAGFGGRDAPGHERHPLAEAGRVRDRARTSSLGPARSPFSRPAGRGGPNAATCRSSATYFSPISPRTCWPPPRRRTRWRSGWKTASRSSNVRDREMLERRYTPGSNTRAVAAGMGCSIDAVYRALRRIHERLFDCITGNSGRRTDRDDCRTQSQELDHGFVLVAPGRLWLGRGCGTF